MTTGVLMKKRADCCPEIEDGEHVCSFKQENSFQQLFPFWYALLVVMDLSDFQIIWSQPSLGQFTFREQTPLLFLLALLLITFFGP